MLHERAEDKTADKQRTHRDPKPLHVRLARDHQQERVDCEEHRAKHQQDMGYQDIGRHIINQPDSPCRRR